MLNKFYLSEKKNKKINKVFKVLNGNYKNKESDKDITKNRKENVDFSTINRVYLNNLFGHKLEIK
jgi:hypothetical protein